MRPKSVERFELLYVISLGFSVFAARLEWERLTQVAGITAALVTVPIVLFVFLGLVLLTSRMGSNISRWTLVVFFLPESILYIWYIPNISEQLVQNPIIAVVSTFETLFAGAAIYFVFRPETKPWFQKTSA